METLKSPRLTLLLAVSLGLASGCAHSPERLSGRDGLGQYHREILAQWRERPKRGELDDW